MYFVPVLFAVSTFLAFPSTVAAFLVGGLVWLYLAFAGSKPRAEQLSTIRLQLAYRTLSVKAMAVMGTYDDTTYEVHALSTPDLAENSDMRSRLRDAAAATSDGWRQAAQRVRRGARRDHAVLHRHLNELVVQLTSQPTARIAGSQNYDLPDDVQEMLLQIARIWRIGPKSLIEILAHNRVAPSPDIAFRR